MPAGDSRTIHLKDYRRWSHLLDQVELTFRLAPKATRVLARLHLRPDPAQAGGEDLRLLGENLRLISLAIDGRALEITPDAEGLTVPAALLPGGAFVLESEVEIAPERNTALDGLYMSRGMYCTQCEPQGFRKITFFPDRPDVMARYRVRVEADFPVLLSNGNLVASGPGWAQWDDPWPKPSYLFALVAGDLRAFRDEFITRSGRKVALAIWVGEGDEPRCAYAMDSLKRSMRWDEEVYGREYDLDQFNIVAVDDFNFGAMENKSLNIFNSKFILASPETATDTDYAQIERIIAHEYFHNWTGNRITCRDWFQLCLKEGLTVYRDQQFSEDMRGKAVKRIEEVGIVRSRQFREDQGPLAHPVRPESFVEINNFYTTTVYRKGAEVIGMLHSLVGEEGYRKALDLYFERHDGEAATIEDWLRVFEDATGRDLSQFALWYSQAGTPRLSVEEAWEDGTYTLTFRQETPPTPGQAEKKPLVLPIAVGLLNPNGDEVVPTTILEMTEAEQSFRFEGLAARPIPSILRNFSAPVELVRKTSAAERAFLLAHDTDPFNRWEAGHSLAREMLIAMVEEGAAPSADWLEALARLALEEGLDPAFRALCLQLPSEEEIALALFNRGHVPDPERIRTAREAARDALARQLAPALAGLMAAMEVKGAYVPDAEGSGKRALRLAAMALRARVEGVALVEAAYATAGNMTDSLGALTILLECGAGKAELARFAERWKEDANVLNMWFSLQTRHAAPEQAAALAESLTLHPDFDWKNPNRVRAVLEGLSANHAGFHHASGAAYRLLANSALWLDRINPQMASRIATAFETCVRYDEGRKTHARAALDRILTTKDISRNLQETVTKLRRF